MGTEIFKIKKSPDADKAGNTILEIMIVVIIVTILAGFAIPLYLKLPLKGRASVAKNNLILFAHAEKIYRVDTGSYINVTVSESPDAIVGRNVTGVDLSSLDNDPNFDYFMNGGRVRAVPKATGQVSPCSDDDVIGLNLDTNVFIEPACYQ